MDTEYKKQRDILGKGIGESITDRDQRSESKPGCCRDSSMNF